MKGSITHAQTVIVILIGVIIILLITYLIIYKNLIPTIITGLRFIINVIRGTP
ncbi:MAG: hypothetical protein QXI58_06065 [Candidatus Micrarchaeia archaeon]